MSNIVIKKALLENFMGLCGKIWQISSVFVQFDLFKEKAWIQMCHSQVMVSRTYINIQQSIKTSLAFKSKVISCSTYITKLQTKLNEKLFFLNFEMIVESWYAPKKRSAFNSCHALILLLSFIDGLHFRLKTLSKPR